MTRKQRRLTLIGCALAVLGFGPRAPAKTMLEFDPLGKVWDSDALKPA